MKIITSIAGAVALATLSACTIPPYDTHKTNSYLLTYYSIPQCIQKGWVQDQGAFAYYFDVVKHRLGTRTDPAVVAQLDQQAKIYRPNVEDCRFIEFTAIGEMNAEIKRKQDLQKLDVT
ncbi:hypothetical protein KMP13_01850 [Epibacterium ulvae]|uniref:hypothetical protein n=1 Tax=Epibacterium ulvae TaxID=1156985 RepID=UPI001BFC877C|nr:hypothetical protein [Epibacterium ulvae]MBT8152660.1 hypothetical protein [Epibacterium ulvae]